jgi:hypothetical protein
MKSCFFITLLLCVPSTFAQTAEQIISVTGVTSTTYAPFILKAHDAKMDAYSKAMLQCDSGSVKRVSEFKMTEVKQIGVGSEQTTREGPFELVPLYGITASAGFTCLPGLKPNLE